MPEHNLIWKESVHVRRANAHAKLGTMCSSKKKKPIKTLTLCGQKYADTSLLQSSGEVLLAMRM